MCILVSKKSRCASNFCPPNIGSTINVVCPPKKIVIVGSVLLSLKEKCSSGWFIGGVTFLEIEVLSSSLTNTTRCNLSHYICIIYLLQVNKQLWVLLSPKKIKKRQLIKQRNNYRTMGKGANTRIMF